MKFIPIKCDCGGNFNAEFATRFDGNIILLDAFKGLGENGEHKCLICGCVWDSFCSNVLLKGCPICRKKEKRTKKLVDNMFAIIEDNYRNKLENTTTLKLLGNYKGSCCNTFHVCLKCKTRWYESPDVMLKGCPKCINNGLEYYPVLYHYRVKC